MRRGHGLDVGAGRAVQLKGASMRTIWIVGGGTQHNATSLRLEPIRT